MIKIPALVLEEIRKHLLKEKENIKNTIQSLNAQDPFSDPERLNDNAASDTEANEESNHDRVSALKNESNKLLEEINGAIDRIEKNTYGFCHSCRQIIDTDRLAVKPTALYCVVCEKKKER
jgi:DnaK suppressor protein